MHRHCCLGWLMGYFGASTLVCAPGARGFDSLFSAVRKAVAEISRLQDEMILHPRGRRLDEVISADGDEGKLA